MRRRAFLQAFGVAAFARGWAACSSNGSGGAGPLGDAGIDGSLDGGGGDLPWSVWRAMREAIRTSPDSIADRAAALVAAKDPQAIFAFVRDAISTLPTYSLNTEKSTRWGPAATLRGGAGSPRDRAELLGSLLVQAGFRATVVMGIPDSQITQGIPTVYAPKTPPAFSPGAIPPALGPNWVHALTGSDSAPPLQLLDPMGVQAKAIFDTINAVLPANISGNAGPYPLFNIPLVALQQGSTTTYLNPLLPTAQFGEPHATQITAAPPADPLQTVQVTLLAARNDAPETQIPLVSVTYSIDKLIGNQLVVATQPSGPLEALIVSPLSSITAFVPTVSLSGPSVPASQRATQTTLGSWITQGGDSLSVAKDGTVSVNGTPVGKGTGASASGVATVKVTQVNASAFPQIELTVSALDAGGKPVVGLGSSAFQVSEDSGPVSFLLRNNGVAAPRVLFLIDTSGSQPAIPAAWASAVAQAIFSNAPGAAVQVAAFDNAPVSSTYAITDATTLTNALTAVPIGGGSTNVYEALIQAEATSPSLIVLMNDGDATDKPFQPQAFALLAGGAPVLAVTCYAAMAVDLAAMQAIAEASGGTSVDDGNLANPATVTTPLTQMVQVTTSAPYRISYTAPTDGPSTRTVAVTAHASGNGSYTVPTNPVQGQAVVGLYLQVTWNDPVIAHTESYTRVLGGHVPGTDITAPGAMAAAIADARAAMLGSALLSFEGSAPTLSTWLADTLTWRLSTETAAKAFAAGDAKGGFSALAGVPTVFPREMPALHAPPLTPSPMPGVLICEDSIRAVLLCTRAKDPPFHADILPFTRLIACTGLGNIDTFRIALLASLRLAVAESAAFKTSTASLLQGKALTLLQQGGVDPSMLPQFPQSQIPAFLYALGQYASWHRLIATDGSTTAFWAVHPSTGSCLGVLPDGSGGGEDPCGNYKKLSNFLDILALLSDILGLPFLSLWAELGKLVALAGVETLLAFSDAPVVVSGDQQVLQIGCSFMGGMLGSYPVNTIAGIEGAETVIVNLVQSTQINYINKGLGCPPSPCG